MCFWFWGELSLLKNVLHRLCALHCWTKARNWSSQYSSCDRISWQQHSIIAELCDCQCVEDSLLWNDLPVQTEVVAALTPIIQTDGEFRWIIQQQSARVNQYDFRVLPYMNFLISSVPEILHFIDRDEHLTCDGFLPNLKQPSNCANMLSKRRVPSIFRCKSSHGNYKLISLHSEAVCFLCQLFHL